MNIDSKLDKYLSEGVSTKTLQAIMTAFFNDVDDFDVYDFENLSDAKALKIIKSNINDLLSMGKLKKYEDIILSNIDEIAKELLKEIKASIED